MNNNSPLVSVIIPNFNNGQYLSDCILSVIGQTYKNIEIVIVDDCSTDNSKRIILELVSKYKNIKYIINDENKGVSSSRNIGLSLCRGDYVTTLDSDDIYYPNKIFSEMKIISEYLPKDVVAFSSISIVDEKLNFIRKDICNPFVYQGNINKQMAYRCIPFGRDVLYRKAILDDIGYFDESKTLYEDWEHKLKLSRKYEFYYSGVAGIKYRKLTTGLSSAKFKDHMISMLNIFTEEYPDGNVFVFKIINGNNLISKICKHLLYFKMLNYLFCKFIR